jgi:hypothetical protein
VSRDHELPIARNWRKMMRALRCFGSIGLMALAGALAAIARERWVRKVTVVLPESLRFRLTKAELSK